MCLSEGQRRGQPAGCVRHACRICGAPASLASAPLPRWVASRSAAPPRPGPPRRTAVGGRWGCRPLAAPRRWRPRGGRVRSSLHAANVRADAPAGRVRGPPPARRRRGCGPRARRASSAAAVPAVGSPRPKPHARPVVVCLLPALLYCTARAASDPPLCVPPGASTPLPPRVVRSFLLLVFACFRSTLPWRAPRRSDGSACRRRPTRGAMAPAPGASPDALRQYRSRRAVSARAQHARVAAAAASRESSFSAHAATDGTWRVRLLLQLPPRSWRWEVQLRDGCGT